MEGNIYLTLVLTIIGTALSVYVVIVPILIWLEIRRKKEDEKMTSFLRYMQIESEKNTREVQRMIKEMHKDTSLILARIFEIVDDPENEKG